MADALKKQSEERVNRLSPFWLKTVFPDAQSLFDCQQRSLEDIKDDCFVVLDANVLLLPYKLEDLSLSDIVAIYEPLAATGRLVVPAQAAREFAKNRSSKLADLVKYLREQASLSGPVLKKKVGSLEEHSAYKAAKALADTVSQSVKLLQSKINEIADEVASNVGEDPVSAAYRSLFENAVREGPEGHQDEKSFSLEMAERYAMSRPPGFSDKGKDDGGAGDLIIWKTILEEGKRRNNSCIFVTADEKTDWYVQSNGPLQPRFELIDEYRAATSATIHILPLSRLLKLFKAPQAAIDDVKRIELEFDGSLDPESRYQSTIRMREYQALKQDLARIERSIRSAEKGLDLLPPFDGNMSLPWNKSYRQIENDMQRMHAQRVAIEGELTAMTSEVELAARESDYR